MSAPTAVTVCVCTYKRPRYLKDLLGRLDALETGDCIDYGVLVIDNDPEGSARPVVESEEARSKRNIRYVHEKNPGFARARNRALEETNTPLMAFIDDDEYPTPFWLLRLYEGFVSYDATAVLGPVVGDFDTPPPTWLVRCGTHHRHRPATGTTIPWHKTRTGNVLMDHALIRRKGIRFDTLYDRTGGEDIRFFREVSRTDDRFVWIDEAVVYEHVPAQRMTLAYCLRRAFTSGSVSHRISGDDMTPSLYLRMIVKAAAALTAYTLLLPFLAFRFRSYPKYLVKMTHHAGRFLSMTKFTQVRGRLIAENHD